MGLLFLEKTVDEMWLQHRNTEVYFLEELDIAVSSPSVIIYLDKWFLLLRRTFQIYESKELFPGQERGIWHTSCTDFNECTLGFDRSPWEQNSIKRLLSSAVDLHRDSADVRPGSHCVQLCWVELANGQVHLLLNSTSFWLLKKSDPPF